MVSRRENFVLGAYCIKAVVCWQYDYSCLRVGRAGGEETTQ